MPTDLECFVPPTPPQPWLDAEVAELMRLRLQLGWGWAEIAAKLGRTESGVKSKLKYEQFSREVRAPSLPYIREPIPDSVLKEQARRVVAFGERSAAQVALGDPPAQFSALASRRTA